jgi:hypothetical protein
MGMRRSRLCCGNSSDAMGFTDRALAKYNKEIEKNPGY